MHNKFQHFPCSNKKISTPWSRWGTATSVFVNLKHIVVKTILKITIFCSSIWKKRCDIFLSFHPHLFLQCKDVSLPYIICSPEMSGPNILRAELNVIWWYLIAFVTSIKSLCLSYIICLTSWYCLSPMNYIFNLSSLFIIYQSCYYHMSNPMIWLFPHRKIIYPPPEMICLAYFWYDMAIWLLLLHHLPPLCYILSIPRAA